MLTVETEGVVAIPNGKEREMVIYNIGNFYQVNFKFTNLVPVV